MRIIPARAGFTVLAGVGRRNRTDHPRSRGVYSAVFSTPETKTGSSPLARGLRRGRLPLVAPCRIIPARAGFTAHEKAGSSPTTDHPRSRGVYTYYNKTYLDAEGSSPLARGLQRLLLRHSPGTRIIPARAGFTPRACRRGGRGRDHPRSRGVYAVEWMKSRIMKGSSPLARGLRCRAGGVDLGTGIIPARAGFTQWQ